MRASRLAALAITTALAATACTSVHGKSDSDKRTFHGTVVTSTCINNGERRRIQEISLPDGNVVRQHDFFFKPGIESIAKCNSVLTGQEQRTAFNEDFSRMLVVKTEKGVQHFGWLLDTKSSGKGKGNAFQPLTGGSTSNSTMLPGAYDPKSKKFSYAEVDPKGKAYAIMSGDGSSFTALGNKNRPVEGEHMDGVYLPNGSHTPRAITGDMSTWAVFDKDQPTNGYAVNRGLVKMGSQEQIYGTSAKTITVKGTVPRPFLADGNTYMGSGSDGIYQVVPDGGTSNTATAKRYTKTAGSVDSAAGAGWSNQYAFTAWDTKGETLGLYVSGIYEGEPVLKVKTYAKGSVPSVIEASSVNFD